MLRFINLALGQIMDILNYKKKLTCRPEYIKGGVGSFLIPKKLLNKNDEKALGIKFVINRFLFGQCYQLLFPEYFNSMPQDSGVLIRGFVDTDKILKNISYPGDIDLLVIPYHGDELILSRSLAIELKIIRATFIKQGKSPNQYGFSQSQALLDAGFPYTAVGHLIISDDSPKEFWRNILSTTIVNAETGECSPLEPIQKDMLPADLISRSFGRLKANRINSNIGCFSSYLSDDGIWYPMGDKAIWNQKTTRDTLDSIWKYYCNDVNSFFDTRRY
jgi:hypothetical protein